MMAVYDKHLSTVLRAVLNACSIFIFPHSSSILQFLTLNTNELLNGALKIQEYAISSFLKHYLQLI